jgi:hypothetical protein
MPQRKGHDRPRVTPPANLFVRRAPFRAEVLRDRIVGEWREHIEEAMADARQMGTGARVVSKDGTVLARFENAARFAASHGPWKPARSETPS